MRCFDAVCELYATLGEDDMAAGLWRRRAGSDDTRRALGLAQHGFTKQAQAIFLDAMSRAVSSNTHGAELLCARDRPYAMANHH